MRGKILNRLSGISPRSRVPIYLGLSSCLTLVAACNFSGTDLKTSSPNSVAISVSPKPLPVNLPLPAPAPAPAPSACTPSYGNFSSAKNILPPACWTPYASASPFNTVIPRGAKQLANSANIVHRIFTDANTFGSGFADVQFSVRDQINDYGHMTYFSDLTDPLYTIHCTEPWGKCAIEGMQVHIPVKAKPAGGSDHHLALIDQTGSTEFDMWGAEIYVDANGNESASIRNPNGGVINCRWGGKLDINGSGLHGDATAAGFGLIAGQIRPEELEAGVINHGFFTGMRCGSNVAVFPAEKHDVLCADQTNAPPMGARFFLDYTDAEINALNVPESNKVVLRAMAKYGIYFGDTGNGANVMGVGILDSQSYVNMGFPDPMVAYAQQYRIPYANDRYRWNLNDGVDWYNHLQIADPCYAQGTCGP